MFFTWVFLAGCVSLSKLLLWLNISCWEKGSQDPRLSFKLSDVTCLSLGSLILFFFFFWQKCCSYTINFQVPRTGKSDPFGRIGGARTFSLISSCQFSSFSTSTISVFSDSEVLHLLRAGQHWFFGEQVGNTGIRWDNLRGAGGQSGLLASSTLTGSGDGGKTCSVLFSVWASRSPHVLGSKKYVAFDYTADLKMLFGPITSPPCGLLLMNVGKATDMDWKRNHRCGVHRVLLIAHSCSTEFGNHWAVHWQR